MITNDMINFDCQNFCCLHFFQRYSSVHHFSNDVLAIALIYHISQLSYSMTEFPLFGVHLLRIYPGVSRSSFLSIQHHPIVLSFSVFTFPFLFLRCVFLLPFLRYRMYPHTIFSPSLYKSFHFIPSPPFIF